MRDKVFIQREKSTTPANAVAASKPCRTRAVHEENARIDGSGILCIRRRLVMALAIILTVSASAAAQAVTKQTAAPAATKQTAEPATTKQTAAPAATKQTLPDEYTGTTANMTPGAGSTLSFEMLQWSSDADRERVLSVIKSATEKNLDELGKALAGLPTVGYIWTGGPVGYALKYAYRLRESDGSERVVVVTDRPLGSWEHPAWKTAGPVAEPAKPFTVVELRLNNKGRGEGKMSLTTPITVDEQLKTVGVANFEKASTLLTDVRRQPRPYWTR